MTSFAEQHGCDVRFDWGAAGLDALAPHCDVVIVVDVLSFSTCVDVAVARGARVYPYRWRDDSAAEHARARRAALAAPRRTAAGEGYTLSPGSLTSIPAGTGLVLPSPNGSELSFRAREHACVWAGCLRNREAVAAAARRAGARVAVIAGGERWPDGSLRPALEDLLGAGALIDALGGHPSREAAAAAATWRACTGDLEAVLLDCASGRELVERGFADDVRLAAALDRSTSAPRLEDDAYVDGLGA